MADDDNKNITGILPTDHLENPALATSRDDKLFANWIAGSPDAYNELFTTYRDDEVRANVKGKKYLHVADVSDSDEALYLGIGYSGGTRNDTTMDYMPYLFYSKRTLSTNAAARRVIKTGMDQGLEWRDERISYGNFTGTAGRMGWIGADHKNRLYKKFLVRIWRAFYPSADLPQPKTPRKRDNEASLSNKRKNDTEEAPSSDKAKKRRKLGPRDQAIDEGYPAMEDVGDGGLGDQPLTPQQESKIELLTSWQASDEASLWQQVNEAPERFKKHLEDKVLVTLIADGAMLDLGHGDVEPMSIGEARKAIKLAHRYRTNVDRSEPYKTWLARMSSGSKGTVTHLTAPSLQHREVMKKRKHHEASIPQTSQQEAGSQHPGVDGYDGGLDFSDPVVDVSITGEPGPQNQDIRNQAHNDDIDLSEPDLDLDI